MILDFFKQFLMLNLFASFVLLFIAEPSVSQSPTLDQTIPFSVDESHITVWNGEYYSPLFIKGVNLGVAVPGSFPGELAATNEDYARWFRLIRDAGFNTIRLYTLHYPRFYEELKRFNEENSNSPLYIFQGVWLEEELTGSDENLNNLTDIFEQEIEENIRAVHGDIMISPRFGKAYGMYIDDISEWVIAYIIGREIHPPEVIETNQSDPGTHAFDGNYLSISDVEASEIWVVERLDHLLTFEMDNYGTQRPVSASSWPTLDPIDHPYEENPYEESASLDLKNINFENAEAGFFASYHAYPYYPNYISRDPRYVLFQDHIGQNSYLGYLTYLKDYYERFPLIIAEFGGSSSWGVAKYAHSGIHHGGYSELEQGKNNIRMLENIHQAGAGGGIQFSLMDEWFKQTWITNPFDFIPDRRILWHNVTAAEQNYGLLGFRKQKNLTLWEEFGDTEKVKNVHAQADYSYFQLQLDIDQHIQESDTIWISLDTYDETLGESILPDDQTVSNRAEFALMITNYEAELYVTEAYDLFGIWFNTSSPEQQYQSTVTDGSPWKLVRWKNDIESEESQDIGELNVNRLGTPAYSTDSVRLYDDRIEVRLPWSLINYTDPSRREVMHDDRSTPETETRFSDGINIGIFYDDFEVETSGRFVWDNWNSPDEAEEYKKASYTYMKEYLPTLPGNPIAVRDLFEVGTGNINHISAVDGLLENDLSLDGMPMQAVLIEPPKNGLLKLGYDGSFTYLAESGFTGKDEFVYRVKAGFNWSDPVTASLQVSGKPVGRGFAEVYPNPVQSLLNIKSGAIIDRVEIIDMLGRRIEMLEVNSTEFQIETDSYASGIYFARIFSGEEFQLKKFVVVQ